MKIRIQKYDVNYMTPPYQFVTVAPEITLDQRAVDLIENDTTGTACANIFSRICFDMDMRFRFFTLSSEPNIDFDVVIAGEFERVFNATQGA